MKVNGSVGLFYSTSGIYIRYQYLKWSVTFTKISYVTKCISKFLTKLLKILSKFGKIPLAGTSCKRIRKANLNEG